MRSLISSLVLSVLFVVPAQAQFGGGGGGTSLTELPSGDLDLDAVIGGAPQYEVDSPTLFRENINKRHANGQPDFGTPDSLTIVNGMYLTFGATDTSRASSTDDGLKVRLLSALTADTIEFQGSVQDSTEWCWFSANKQGSIEDGKDFWFYIDMSWFGGFIDAANTVFGLWGSNNAQGATRGSPYEHNPTDLWDGTINDSIDCVLFNMVPGITADSIRVFAQKDNATNADTTFVLDSTISGGQVGGNIFAFHLKGRDTVDYYANGTTGSIDVSSVFDGASTTPLTWGLAMQDAGGALNWVYVENGWWAYGNQ